MEVTRVVDRVRSEAGFGLMSTLVAMVLLAIAVTALSSSAMMSVAVRTDSSVRATATAIGASYLEEVKARPPKTVTSEAAVKVNGLGMDDPNGRFERTLEVTPEEGLPYTKRLAVSVVYPSGKGRTGTLRLETVYYEGEN